MKLQKPSSSYRMTIYFVTCLRHIMLSIFLYISITFNHSANTQCRTVGNFQVRTLFSFAESISNNNSSFFALSFNITFCMCFRLSWTLLSDQGCWPKSRELLQTHPKTWACKWNLEWLFFKELPLPSTQIT